MNEQPSVRAFRTVGWQGPIVPPMSWREEMRKAQHGRCILCDKPIDGDHGSWDHFIPRVLVQGGGKGTRVGLAYWTHGKCNSLRRHDVPTADVIDRAKIALDRLPFPIRGEAQRNIDAAMRAYVEYIAALARLAK